MGLLSAILGFLHKLLVENESIKKALKENKIFLSLLILNMFLVVSNFNTFKQNVQKDHFIFNVLNNEKSIKAQYDILKEHTTKLLEIADKNMKLKEAEYEFLKKECAVENLK